MNFISRLINRRPSRFHQAPVETARGFSFDVKKSESPTQIGRESSAYDQSQGLSRFKVIRFFQQVLKYIIS